MSNFLVGLVAGFFLCVWALDANPVTAAITLVDRVSQVEVSIAAEAPPNTEAAENMTPGAP
ncbi:hypothetical protein [Parvibaculum sp.]|jgi:hypothetical protein|uniref:hypothetical protein n=1 Tax=Parvibaculum sp. TaxID=2024848 RepID=UPI001B0E73C7|nr:hypothetical protein [Parvibaculum sp.]MBO6634436.1 hypothetical protein [Parvibaculum sp.]MBO6679133.1 hypothetical protein [Parvibaculum sp.]MBO6686308.1 hypothetical protein [Parvibaculum sp.]MBO6904139.1 hypothetical protein [Parvibaculum sp.]